MEQLIDIDLRAFGMNYETESAEEITKSVSWTEVKVTKPRKNCYNKRKEQS